MFIITFTACKGVALSGRLISAMKSDEATTCCAANEVDSMNWRNLCVTGEQKGFYVRTRGAIILGSPCFKF